MPIHGVTNNTVSSPRREPMNEPTFRNASKLLAIQAIRQVTFGYYSSFDQPSEQTALSYVRVKDGVANIMANKCALIRRKCDAPDGLYTVSYNGHLNQIESSKGSACRYYPDVDLLQPPLKQMKPLCRITNEEIGKIIPIVQEIRRVKGTVVIDSDSIWMQQNTSIGMSYPFNLPDPVLLNPEYLEVGLIELLQYPVVYLLRELHKNQDGENPSPVILGVDWGNCFMLAPMRS